MSFRREFLKVLNGEKCEEIPMVEFMHFWTETCELYAKDTPEELCRHFGLSGCVGVPYDFNLVPAFDEKILSEDENFIVKIDCTGVTCKVEKGTSAMPHYIDFPIKDRKTYEEFAKRLDPNSPERVLDLTDFKKSVKENDALTQIVIRGIFAFLRDFIHFEDLMMMFYDDPELIREMIANHTQFVIKLFGRVFEQFVPDLVYLGEDMAYKNGSMISPKMVEEFIFPAWKKVIDFCKSRGVKHIILDSDGNTMDILEIAVRAGFTCTLPIERAAGMDGEIVRERFPTLGLIGGVDKLMLARGKAEIDFEVQKAKRLFAKGRYIPSCDHSVPPIVSYKNYKYYNTELKNG